MSVAGALKANVTVSAVGLHEAAGGDQRLAGLAASAALRGRALAAAEALVELDDAAQQELGAMAGMILRRMSQAVLRVTPSWRESSAAEGAFFMEASSQMASNHLRRSVRVQARTVPAVSEPW